MHRQGIRPLAAVHPASYLTPAFAPQPLLGKVRSDGTWRPPLSRFLHGAFHPGSRRPACEIAGVGRSTTASAQAVRVYIT